MEEMRLQKYLSMCGVASRRHAEEMILQGRVTVNGKKVEHMGCKVGESDEVRVDGERVMPRSKPLTYVFYKPPKVVTTLDDPQGRTTVKDFFKHIPVPLYPVGRLDYHTEGLLLMTNDGDLAYRLTHPKNDVTKTYLAVIQGALSEEQLKTLRQGVKLEDGVTAPCRVYVQDCKEGRTWVKLILSEGRNRQVRRMFEFFGLKVLKLKREAIGRLTLKGLKPGQCRRLSPQEKDLLFLHEK